MVISFPVAMVKKVFVGEQMFFFFFYTIQSTRASNEISVLVSVNNKDNIYIITQSIEAGCQNILFSVNKRLSSLKTVDLV